MDITSVNFPFYAHYFHTFEENNVHNFFNVLSRDDALIKDDGRPLFLESEARARLSALESGNILRPFNNDLLIPLEGALVLPNPIDSPKIPFVLIGHGMFPGNISKSTNNLLANPNLSYAGYDVLQNELATHGIGSISINLNIVNDFNNVTWTKQDNYHRIQIFFLHLLLLRYLAGESVTVSGTEPIKYQVGTEYKTMSEALTLSDTPGGSTALQKLQTLKGSLNGKIDFTNLGFMGHSRGASAVSRIFEYFYIGTTAGEASASFNVNPTLNGIIKNLVDYAGKPLKDHVKCIFALQPDELECKIESTNTMFFVVAGSHDEDVGGRAASIYESVNSPKVMIYVNGGTHKRFNSVWRSPPGGRGIPAIERMISGDPVIRVLSNRKHDAISRVIFSSFFRATQKNETQQFLYFSGENNNVRYPVRVDIQRAWNFGFPFQALPTAWKKYEDSLKNTDILNATGAGPPDITLPFDDSGSLQSSLNSQVAYTEQVFSAFLYVKPNNADTAVLTVPIDVDLNDYTHLSMRFAKWYKVRKSAPTIPPTVVRGIPRRVDLRNFTFKLYENNTDLGLKIEGKDVNSLLHRAYPTLKYTPGGGSVAGYYWDTSILLQTVEVRLSEFTGADASLFTRVNRIIVEFTAEAYKNASDEDIFVFNDILLTKRDINLPVTP